MAQAWKNGFQCRCCAKLDFSWQNKTFLTFYSHGKAFLNKSFFLMFEASSSHPHSFCDFLNKTLGPVFARIKQQQCTLEIHFVFLEMNFVNVLIPMYLRGSVHSKVWLQAGDTKGIENVAQDIVDEIVFKPLNNQANNNLPSRLSEKFFGFQYYSTKKQLPCQWLWNAPTILWDGRVSACCRNYQGELLMGNINEVPLMDIWHNHAYQELRRSHARSQPPDDCRGCTDLHDKNTRQWLLNRWIRKQLGRPDFKIL
ncbi:MAG: SPASM domain-containing protein [Proteobacteria bacterium]|nr:SPASM domain-containing protein [Pseudomonadota bacterium]